MLRKVHRTSRDVQISGANGFRRAVYYVVGEENWFDARHLPHQKHVKAERYKETLSGTSIAMRRRAKEEEEEAPLTWGGGGWHPRIWYDELRIAIPHQAHGKLYAKCCLSAPCIHPGPSLRSTRTLKADPGLAGAKGLPLLASLHASRTLRPPVPTVLNP